jgi:PAS domain S-box-containing protein
MAGEPESDDDMALSDAAVGRALDARTYGRGILAAMPGAAVIAFDRELRISLAEGEEFARLGMDVAALEGRMLPDVLSARSWAQLKGPYTAALRGHTATVELSVQGRLYSIRVSPLLETGRTVGALAVSRSVSEQRRLESVVSAQDATARSSRRLLASAFDRAPIGMSLVGLDGCWLRVNDAYCQMLGYRREELLGKTFLDLTHPDDVAQDLEWTARATAGEADSLEREKRYVARDGSVLWVLARSEIVRDDDGRPVYSVTLLQDITARRGADLAVRASERRLRSIIDNTPQAVSVQDRDYRYEVVNRAFEERFDLDPGWVIGRRDDEILLPSLLAVDRSSHDRVLQTGEPVELEETVPGEREGEDRIYLTVKFPLRDEAGAISSVCGIFNDITDRKRNEQELHDRVTWTAAIHDAVAQDRLVLHGQPIVNLATGAVEQAELLVRMRDRLDRSRMIAPGVFVPPAERFDLVGVIDRWVVARAIELARHHRVEVNLSGRTISDPEMVAEIEAMVLGGGAPPENIIFEITETAVAENLDSARRFAERLRAIGCSFALDDFGVGFGAFTYLKHLPVDYLKIDIQFVRDFVSSESDRQVVHAMVGVANDFGIKTIAEGVEDQATLELIGLLGVDYAQGYWIGRPGPIDELWPTTATPVRTP